ncbi:MAG: hypothetical protein BGO38_05335 [Cellulomonas sp. 73-145]|uniref:hypothetical protein n=1 Tax=Cellulomonas sp. 73-145 TaxID=1895739 RepID=UPI000926D8EA|nr:hypothetical protein [Cellulomonas sp. 73-145]MBN9326851.1 hypothetical protein [Cellulomonas sp.]OJV57558.1 MAG: hypothetical protein BGO38_05335 [Cellulomonas sp. 73-145]
MSGIEEHYNALETLEGLIAELNDVQAEIDALDDGDEDMADLIEERDDLFEDVEDLCDELGLDISQVIESD